VLRLLLAVALAGYPLAVYFLLDTIAPQAFVIVLGTLGVVRVAVVRGTSIRVKLGLVVAVVLFCSVALAGAALPILKLYPMLINLAAAAYTGYTIFSPPSAIHRLSLLLGMAVEGPAVRYTRNLTLVWMVFFLVNTVIAAYTAIFAATSTWAWYNGFISYALVGTLIIVEYPIRIRYQRRHRPG
jgi:uncharacterized membrane protein